MGRPRKVISAEQVEQLAAIQCSYAEMAAVLGCNESTLTRRFAQAIKKGRENGKASLKRMQYKKAMEGNPTMLIWLGKQHLGQADKSAEERALSAQETANAIMTSLQAIQRNAEGDEWPEVH